MSEKLKPCPFCGNSTPVVCNGGGTIFVQCTKCDTDGPFFDEEHREKAIVAWNTRANDDRWRSVAEQAEKALIDLVSSMERLDLKEGHCMCGASPSEYGHCDNHGYVDAGEHIHGERIEKGKEALAAFDSLRKEGKDG